MYQSIKINQSINQNVNCICFESFKHKKIYIIILHWSAYYKRYKSVC